MTKPPSMEEGGSRKSVRGRWVARSEESPAAPRRAWRRNEGKRIRTRRASGFRRKARAGFRRGTRSPPEGMSKSRTVSDGVRAWTADFFLAILREIIHGVTVGCQLEKIGMDHIFGKKSRKKFPSPV